MILEEYLDDVKSRLRVFDKFHFVEEPHIYWWLDEKGNRQEAETSMTALIHSYSTPFEEEEIAKRESAKLFMLLKPHKGTILSLMFEIFRIFVAYK